MGGPQRQIGDARTSLDDRVPPEAMGCRRERSVRGRCFGTREWRSVASVRSLEQGWAGDSHVYRPSATPDASIN